MRQPGIYHDIPNLSYHADNEWISSSQLKVALNSPHHYYYFVKNGLGLKEATKSKDFGSLVHKLILEIDTFTDEYAIFDGSGLDMRRKADKERRDAFEQDNAGKIIVSLDDYQRASMCRDSVMSHPDARRYLEMDGQSEVSAYAELEHTLPGGEMVPFKVRVRPDRVAQGRALLDLKTSKNANKDSFIRDAFSPWGYHYDLSAALYTRVWTKLTGEILPFIFIVVHNDQPWETGVYLMGEESMKKGNAKLERAMSSIIMAERSGRWEFQSEMETI